MVLVYDPLADKFDRDVHVDLFLVNIAQQFCIELDKYSTCNTSFADCLEKETNNNEKRKRKKITYRRTFKYIRYHRLRPLWLWQLTKETSYC